MQLKSNIIDFLENKRFIAHNKFVRSVYVDLYITSVYRTSIWRHFRWGEYWKKYSGSNLWLCAVRVSLHLSSPL